MKQTLQKKKRKVNRSKRPKLNSKGFKVYKNTRVYIAETSDGGWSRSAKPAPRKELVDMFRDFWNNDPSIIAMRKHISAISITTAKTINIAGTWDKTKEQVSIKDDQSSSLHWYKGTVVHEIVGHAFWDFSRKWRREELVKFNELANKIAPVNNYVKKNEEKWRSWNDDLEEVDKFHKKYDQFTMDDIDNDEYQKDHDALKDLLKINGHETMTRYTNEQHSAITEIVYGYGEKEILISESDKQKLVKAWKELHY